MLSFLTALTLSLAPQGQPNPPVVVNEFQYDDYGIAPDQNEFVELYNRSVIPVDISGWTVTAEDVSAANRVVYTIPASTILAPGQFWVIGAASIPNVNQVVIPTPPFTEIFLNSNQAITLRDLTNTIVDTVAYECYLAVLPANLREGDGLWGTFQSFPSAAASWSRGRDGLDTNDNGRDFRLMPSTPGATNNRTSLIPYASIYDTMNVGTPLPEFGYSFKPGIVIDPTIASVSNPNAIPPSPQGGNAAIFWDDTGGGNANMLLSDLHQDLVFEAYVYFDAKLELTSYYETWSIGAQGACCPLFNTPDPSRTLLGATSANGNTGAAWTFQCTSTSAVLYLVDHNNGGKDDVVLGQIVLTQGVNDGWRRLRLHVQGNRVEGFFGGTYGMGDGTRIAGTLSAPGQGGFYIGYREFILANTNCRPPTLDQVAIRFPTTALAEIGTATATTKGTPLLGTNGFATLGFGGFALQGSGLVPSGQTVFAIGASQLGTPIPLQSFGGQAGSFVYISLDVLVALGNSASGTASLNLGIPPVPSLSGASLYAQDFDLDPALMIGLPLGNSKALKITLGQ